MAGFITINSTNTNSVYKPDRDPDLCHRQLQHDAKGVARSGGCSPSSAAGHSASLEDEAALSERGGEGRRWVVVGRLPGGQWMSAFGTTQVVSEVVAWGPSVQLSQGQSLVTLRRYNFIGDYLKTSILLRSYISKSGLDFPGPFGSRIKKD